MSKLKPCPLCGAEAFVWQTNSQAWVQCSECDCGTHKRHLIQISADTEEQAIEIWNTRYASKERVKKENKQ